MAALTSQADAALAAANPQTPVGGGSLGPDGGLGGMFTVEGSTINTHTGTLVVLDWDLTLDWRSTKYNVGVFDRGDNSMPYRERRLIKEGYSLADDDDYARKLWVILTTLKGLRDEGYCDVVIITRNSVSNVEAMIADNAENVASMPAEHGFPACEAFDEQEFAIISYPENRVPEFSDRKCKAQLLHEYYPGMEHVDKIIFVDDSHGDESREHERFEAYGLPGKYKHKMEVCHVKVHRCPRYELKSKEGKKIWPYGGQGLGNQVHKLDEIATLILGTVDKPSWTWQSAVKIVE